MGGLGYLSAMDGLTLAGLAVLVVLALLAWLIWTLVRSSLKRSQAHTGTIQPPLPHSAEPPSTPSASPARETTPVSLPPLQPPPPPPPAVVVQHPSPAGAWQAEVTYTRADGSTSVRLLTIYSYNRKNSHPYSLNARQDGQTITKQFLIERISKLVLIDDELLELTAAEELLVWIVANVREKQESSTRKRPAPQIAVDQPKKPEPSAGAAAQAPSSLSSLLPEGSKGFAVFDLETTGFGRTARIVEIALVTLDPSGTITEVWETLVNPGITIPNSHIHGISDQDVANAPDFAEIAGLLAAKLDGHVLVAHNLRAFDLPILTSHYEQISGVMIELGDGVDTMPRSGARKLKAMCAQLGVELDDAEAHSALGDTRALAHAFRRGLPHVQPASNCVTVSDNSLLAAPARTLTRAMLGSAQTRSVWEPMQLTLTADQSFASTGPKSTKTDTPIKRGQDALIRLGLTYRRISSIPKRNPPDFLLTTSLNLSNTKMREARERSFPVVLLSDITSASIGSTIRAWRWSSGA